MPKLQPATFTFTRQQLEWLEKHSERTGLNKSDIVRRSVDTYKDAEEVKEQRRYFSPEQRQSIRDIARRRGIGEIEVVREAVNKEVKFRKKLYEEKKL